MALPTNEEVCEGFLIYWPLCANGYLGGLIPVSRVYYDQVAERTTTPNALITAELTNIELTTGKTCLVKYNVMIDAETYDTDSGRLTAAIQSGFACNNINPKIDIANAVTTIHVRTMSGGKVEIKRDHRQDGNDMKIITAKYEVLVQGELEWQL